MSCLASIDKLIIRPVYKAQFMKNRKLYDYTITITFGFSAFILILLTLNKKYKGRDPWYQDPSRFTFGLSVTK